MCLVYLTLQNASFGLKIALYYLVLSDKDKYKQENYRYFL